MKKYQRILVAMALQPERDLVLLKKAQKLAEQYEAEVFLLHAVEHLVNYMAYEVPGGINIEDLLLQEAEKKMSTYYKIIDVSHCIIKVGSAPQLILSEAEELGVDLILLGRHKKLGMRLLLGSTTNYVVHHAQSDVLAAHF